MLENQLVYCIKDFVGEKPYEKFDIHRFYTVQTASDKIIIIYWDLNPDWTCALAFNLIPKKFSFLPNFDDYFVSLKESRKLKLENLFTS